MRNFVLILMSIILASCQGALGSKADDGNVLAGLEHRAGFIDLYIDDKENRVLAKLPTADDTGTALRLIHSARLTGGLGSNPVGLDRGWGTGGAIIAFRRLGDKVIIEQENLAYRASPENPLEERAVRESFATSFLASAEVMSSKNGLVIDLTDFLTSDILGLVQYLKDAEQGSFKIAKDRTLIDTSNVFAFPDNVEMDVFFTLTSADPGEEVATTAANSNTPTLIQHHSFARLPEAGYTPLKSDPRAGVIERTYYDYSAALDEPIETRLARRYRLEKNAAGKTLKPIVFYIDSGAPEPIKSALLDGARWWEDAFAAAGFPDGYRVEVLPEDVHPLDIRYNVVQWVHRQTRGWSYGGGVSDPRTGEMLKGHVNLGSLRVRQDRMIFEGLSGTAKTGSGEADDPIELALDRIRQLSAHEVGHALGFAHNFAASTYGKGSVMDYPAPDVRITNGEIDFSNTYGVGVGAWDKFAATWLYSQTDEKGREALIQTALSEGLVFVSDRDARGVGTSHPKASVWDNRADPIAGLNDAMQVRAHALKNFGTDRIRQGQPLSNLGNVIVPIYLYHRYQTAAAAKLIGGMNFNYGLAGDGQPAMKIVDAARQKQALAAVLKTLDPKALDIPDKTLDLIGPAVISWSFADNDRERFRPTAYPAFDVTAAADTAADITFDALLNPRRAARLIEFKRRDTGNLGFMDMLQATRQVVMRPAPAGREGEIAKGLQARFAFALMELGNSEATPGVKARTDAVLRQIQQDLRAKNSGHGLWLVSKIEAHLTQEATPRALVITAKALPPGGPIGQNGLHYGQLETCWHCD